VPPALVQRDHRNARLGCQLLKPLGHVVGVPRTSVVLAEDQVVVLPRRARLQPELELGLAFSGVEASPVRAVIIQD
jgi:hypothetical protein